MALGANIGMPADGIKGRIVMTDAGDGFPPVTLPAGKVCARCVNVFSLRAVTVFTTKVLVKLDSLV
jgi:hypothetical protein